MKFPSDLNPTLKMEYVYRTQEALRFLHNKMGDWHRDGINKTTWELLPATIKRAYPYHSQLAIEEWQGFLRSYFNPKQDKISEAIGGIREEMKASSRFAIDIEELLSSGK